MATGSKFFLKKKNLIVIKLNKILIVNENFAL